jgi:hypothetical protein
MGAESSGATMHATSRHGKYQGQHLALFDSKPIIFSQTSIFSKISITLVVSYL